MEKNGKSPLQFPGAAGIPVIGQPTILGMFFNVTAQLMCPCGGPNATVMITASQPSPCPSCQQIYNVIGALGPQGLQVQLQMIKPEKPEVPS